ncbi:GreA/GreB family elongation factor [Pontibacter oryzae]|uniref:Transcription elongation factor GreAB n=1 Tax=Pontibacter oryzae TaxID=2304593 RepID=A0A399SIU7_9BACT|nr:GreA/GreB family elongation factor [Pontibacter oryzae]RIJ41807.1 transcription elongation factor GreAB [Pontibacter oryzae]
MSRAFVKEDDAGEPPLIPSRPALPPGTANYVTPEGLRRLKQELDELERERAAVEANHDDEANRTRQLTILNGRLAALYERISSAKIVELQNQPADEVRFGSTVTLRTLEGGKVGALRTFQLVGVDEASIADRKIAFIAPIAKAITGARQGQQVSVQLGRNREVVEVISIKY